MLEVGGGEFFFDEFVFDGPEFAAVDAFQAANAFRAVGSLIDFDIHRAVFQAFVAQRAFVFVSDHPEKADLVEQSKDRTKRAGGPAERPFADDHPDDKQDQNPHFPGKQEPELPPDIRTDGRQRKARLQCPRRAYPFAEPCLPEPELIHDKKR